MPENSKIRESEDKAKTKVMQSEREGNAKIREAKAKAKEMQSAREENAKIYGYKKGGLVKKGKPKLAKKGWR